MSREIKFRFWLGHTNKMTYEHTLKEIFKLGWDLTDDIIPQQFLGFTDENGKEVYEGDIISSNQWNPSEYKVIFEDGEFCFVSLKGVEKPYTNPIHYVENFSIIGNIYENPELLSERS